jgi:DNA-binding transcriptional LysR family regulator
MSSPSLDLIPSFHAVMTHGSLSAAARALRLAQPTVRRQIEALEGELGTQLFTRSANGLTPTAMARTLLPLAVSVIEEAAALGRVASAEADALEGTVRITTSRVVAGHILPALIRDMRTQAPGLRFEVAATDHAEDLTHRAADIAIRFTAPRQQALIASRLPDCEVGLFAAPGLPLSDGQDALHDMPFIADDREDLILPGLAAAGLPAPRNVVLRCDDPLAQITAIAAEVGVGFCQVKLAQRLGLRRVLPDLRHLMPVWLVVHEDQARIARIAFVFAALKRDLRAVL